MTKTTASAIRDLSIILGVNLIFRLLCSYKYIFNSELHFISSWVPYFIEPDSYYFYKILSPYFPLSVIYLLPILTFVIGIIAFYYSLRLIKSNHLVLLCILLGTFPLFITKTVFGYIDTPPYIFMILCIINYLLLRVLIKHEWTWIFLIIILAAILESFWPNGALIVVAIAAAAYVYESYNDKVVFAGLLAIGIIASYHSFNKLLDAKPYINELSYMTYPGFYLLLMGVVLITFGSKSLNKPGQRYIFISTLIYSIIAIMFRRFGFMAVIFLILMLAYSIQHKRSHIIFIIVLILSSMIVSGAYFIDDASFMDRNTQTILESLNCNSSMTLIGDWGLGHYYSAFTDCNVLYFAHPDPSAFKTYMQGLYSGNATHFDNLAGTKNYYLIVSAEEVGASLLMPAEFNILNSSKSIKIYSRR